MRDIHAFSGCKMRDIHAAKNANIRVRGRGSGYLEIEGQREAPVSLMVVITSDRQDAHGFVEAVGMIAYDVKCVAEQFQTFCRESNVNPPLGPFYMIGDLSKEAEKLLVSTFPSTTLGGSPAAVSTCPSISELLAMKTQESPQRAPQFECKKTQDAGRVDGLLYMQACFPASCPPETCMGREVSHGMSFSSAAQAAAGAKRKSEVFFLN